MTLLIPLIMAFALTAGCSSSSGASSSSTTIDIAQVGAYTGVASDGAAGQGIGLQAWVKYTNAHGGIEGHKIRLTTADSKSDPTTEVSETVRLAGAKPVAFVGMGTFNMQASLPVLKSSKIPVVGGNTSDIVWNSAPNLFSNGTGFSATNFSGFGAHPAGKTKLGLLYCKESPGCTQVYSILFKQGVAKASGLDPVYSAEVSLSAPSFAAQCIAAKQAGVQVLSAALTAPVLISMASQCAKQDYHPTYVFGGGIASDAVAAAPGFEGAMSSTPNAPWFLTSGPVATMRAAMQEYQPGKPILSTTVQGWSAGEVFAKAVKNALGGDKNKKLTSADLIKGLGKIKDDTFGGLTPPLTYTASGIQAPVNCYFRIQASGGKWTAPDGDKATCPDSDTLATLDAVTTSLVKK